MARLSAETEPRKPFLACPSYSRESLPLCRCHHIVLQDVNLAAGTPRAVYFPGPRAVAHAHHINPVHRDVMSEHQVAHHGVRHLLRAAERGLALAGEKPRTSTM